MKRVNAFELVDHGIENSQYFQGCGTSFTKFDEVVTGIGDNPAEAIGDCLDQIGMAGWDADDLEKRILKIEGWSEFPVTPCVSDSEFTDTNEGDEYAEMDGNDIYYHISIRWK